MNAIALLKADHKTVEALFRKFEALGDKAAKQKRKVVDQIVKELSIHAAVEEQLLYPAIRSAVPEHAELALEAIEEHHVVKWLLEEVRTMAPDHERFAPKMRVLMEAVRHHVKEEEGELFPELRRALSGKQLIELGEQLMLAKRVAPTRPHPRAPDSPPGNLVTGPLAGAMDRAGDALRSLAGRATRGRRGKDTGSEQVH